MLKVVCDTQVPEAQQQQQPGQPQCVHVAVPNDVEHVLNHMEVAVTTGDTLLSCRQLSLLIWYLLC